MQPPSIIKQKQASFEKKKKNQVGAKIQSIHKSPSRN